MGPKKALSRDRSGKFTPQSEEANYSEEEKEFGEEKKSFRDMKR